MARSLPPSDPAAFTLPGERAEALLLHGYTSSPYELRLVGEGLSEIGVASTAPLLPGHGTVPDELNRVSRAQWLECGREAFAALDEEKPRLLVGSSMGGLLAIRLAAELGDKVHALVLIAPALTLTATGVIGGALARGGLGQVYAASPKAEKGGDCAAADGRARNPAYDVLPVDGLAEFDLLRIEAGEDLEAIRCPVCVFQGAHDRTVSAVASELVAARSGSSVVERYILPNSRHILGIDVDRDRLVELTQRFVESTLGTPREAS